MHKLQMQVEILDNLVQRLKPLADNAVTSSFAPREVAELEYMFTQITGHLSSAKAMLKEEVKNNAET